MKETNIDNEEGRHERVWSEERKREKGDTTRCRSERKEGKVVMQCVRDVQRQKHDLFHRPGFKHPIHVNQPSHTSRPGFVYVLYVLCSGVMFCYVWYNLLCGVGYDSVSVV